MEAVSVTEAGQNILLIFELKNEVSNANLNASKIILQSTQVTRERYF